MAVAPVTAPPSGGDPSGGDMTWVDLVVFGFLLISGLLAFARGLVR